MIIVRVLKQLSPSDRSKEEAAAVSILKISIKTSALKSINFPSFLSLALCTNSFFMPRLGTHGEGTVMKKKFS
jgi:hypothetical protein